MRRSQSRLGLLNTPLLWREFYPFLLWELFARRDAAAQTWPLPRAIRLDDETLMDAVAGILGTLEDVDGSPALADLLAPWLAPWRYLR